ncbi:alpha/beta hydrolase family protein [Sandarakinorhabdus sp.]|uniref:alpha/beta hydrolase family protein n=1 Tax=Sandarakinorhabdus sp. TaxID=1916663 RepID=UPI003F6EA373
MLVRSAPLLLLLALVAAAPAHALSCEGLWRDNLRGRDVPVRITLPDRGTNLPAVLWTPGLGGGVGNANRYVSAWTAAGVAVVRVQHPGSDAAVYAKVGTPAERNARVRAGYTPAQVLARIGDIGFVVDELSRRRREGACDLRHIDPQRLGLAGHSMGGWVVQAIAGQRDANGETPALDRRFRAFIAMSTTGPADPAAAARAFGGIGRPMLVVTGTRDGIPANAPPEIAAREIAERSAPYIGGPADGRKALLILADAGHMVFAGDNGRNPVETGMQDRIAAVTSLWWRRWLLGDERVDTALAKPALLAGDVWERK